MWKHLLVPLDFSECSGRALELAVALAEHDGAKLTLVHVSLLPPNLPADARVSPPGVAAPMRIDAYTTQSVREHLERIAAVPRQRGLEVHTLAVLAPADDVAAALLRVAGDVGAAVIVVGTHGRSGFAHFLLGSVAERIIRHATVPVITVRSHSSAAEPMPAECVAEDELAG